MKSVSIVNQIRAVMPLRPLTLGEAYAIAELQATKTLKLMKLDRPAVQIGRIAELPKIEVHVEPRHRMPTLAGAAKWKDGRWVVVINKNDVPGRRRFSLAHEFKHILDNPALKITYRAFGYGDPDRHDQQIEGICNYFAACLLMPRTWVKRAWTSGIRDEEALAGLFNVSLEAMHTRLVYLGFIDDLRKPLAEYFRTETPLTLTAQAA